MKRSLFLLIVTAILSLLALSIALPTVYLHIGGQFKRVRGLDPKDFKPDFLIPEFGFKPSLDLNGGKVSTINIDLSVLPKSQRLTKFSQIRNIIFFRLTNIGFTDFELDDVFNEDTDQYKLFLRYPEDIDQSLLTLMLQKGEVSAWVPDPQNKTDQSKSTDPFAGRLQTGITNSDFSYVAVISDSRIYLSDKTKPSNFGLKVVFNDESSQKMANAVLQSTSSPMLFAIDQQPVAFQAPGVSINTANIGTELLLATFGSDTQRYNSIVAAVMASPTIDFPVKVDSTETIAPKFDTNTLNLIKAGSLISFVLAQGLLIFYFRKYAKPVVLLNVIFLTWSIALMKIFNVTLSFATYAGFMLMLSGFMSFIVLLMYRTRVKVTGGLTKDELQQAYSRTSSDYNKFFLLTLSLALILQLLRMVNLNQFALGVGFGAITGLLVMNFVARAILPYLLLQPKKK